MPRQRSEELKAMLANLTSLPGVYQMRDAEKSLLYIGKAKNLKNRVSSYFSQSKKNIKTQALVAKIASFEVTVTQSETEALLLEQTLIKQFKPPYNILLRDDKSYPYIYLSDHPFPRLCYHRGPQKQKGQYFGPFPSGFAVRESLDYLQKLFKVRQCDDVFFRNRTRPCLQYQIKRCSAPCVDFVDVSAYAESVRLSSCVLEGRNAQVIEDLIEQMDAAAQNQAYEQAGELRDKIRALRHVQETQVVDGGQGNVDVLGVAIGSGVSVVSVVFIRQGRIIGSKNYLIKSTARQQVDTVHILEEFLPQFYIGHHQRDYPDQILVEVCVADAGLIGRYLSDQLGKPVTVESQVKGRGKAWLKMAILNAQKHQESLESRQDLAHARIEELMIAFDLDEWPGRLECFDISHTSGTQTVASCVVFDQDGPAKTYYRRFEIRDITPGDDYAAMEQVLRRRYTRVKRGESPVPGMVIIDGGKGQLKVALDVFKELQLDEPLLLGVAKGPTRRLGMEEIFLIDQNRDHLRQINLDKYPKALNLIQHIRDEAHRFAITGHRAKVQKRIGRSGLEAIPGVGPKKRQQLLKYFGGLQEVRRASISDLEKVPGISPALAESIYDYLHQ